MSDVEETSEPEYIDPASIYVKEPVDDIPGVKPKVAQGIYQMLKKGRRYFGSSGASLTTQAFNPESDEIKPELAKIGLEGERETTKILKEWVKDKPNAVLIDSVHINMDYKDAGIEDEEDDGSEQLDEETGIIDGKDTDHVLIIGDEVILIDTKRWKAKRNYSISDNGWVLRTKKSFPGGHVRMKNAIYLWLEYLHEDAVLTGIVFVNTDEKAEDSQTSVTRNLNWYKQSYRLVEKKRFIELLDDKWSRIDEEDKTTINSTLVAQVAVSAVKPYDVYKRVFNTNALANFK